MTVTLKIIGFGVFVIAIFVGFGSYFDALSGGGGFAAASGDVSADAGEAIFWGKGMCATCHAFGDKGGAVRCPNLGAKAPFAESIGVRAATRKPGQSAAEYLVESIYDPNAFVVAGFPRGVMPPMHRPPVALSDDEIRSVILYLLQKSDIDVDAAMTKRLQAAQRKYATAEVVAEAPRSIKLPKGSKFAGRRKFEELKCHLCHKIRGIEWTVKGKGGIGPDLTGIGAIQSTEYLFESIVSPNAIILPDPSPDKKYAEGGGSKMPEWGHAITVQQAVDMAAFLKSLTEVPPPEVEPAADAGVPAPDGGA